MTESVVIIAELRRIREMLTRRAEPPRPIAVGTEEAARLLSVSTKTLGKWTRQGKIRRFVDDGVFRYRVADLEAFAEEMAKVEHGQHH